MRAAAVALLLCAPAAAGAEPPRALAPTDTATIAPAEDFEFSLVPKPLKHARWAALVDGGWSVAMTAGWITSARHWDAPYPEAVLGLLTARILYGTTHSILVASELALFTALIDPSSPRLSDGRFLNEWWLGANAPGCAVFEGTGCGLGLGGYSELSVVLDGWLELAMSGGWIQGRSDDDEARTLMESTWIEAPLMARARASTRLGPLRLRASAGPGLYFGLHAGHAHPRGPRPEGESPFELRVLDGGLGVGLSARAAVGVPDGLELEAALDLAPFLVWGGGDARGFAAPLDQAGGRPVWRRLVVGVALPRLTHPPVRMMARVAFAELSPRPVTRAGHVAGVLAFEVPLVFSD